MEKAVRLTFIYVRFALIARRLHFFLKPVNGGKRNVLIIIAKKDNRWRQAGDDIVERRQILPVCLYARMAIPVGAIVIYALAAAT